MLLRSTALLITIFIAFMNYKLILLCLLLWSCGDQNKTAEKDPLLDSWEEVTKSSEGTTVHFMMWQGSPVANEYINNYVIPTLKKTYNIDLKIVSGQGPEIVQMVMGEKEAGVQNSQIDIVWINGETFFQLKKIQGLWGPFVQKLPNAAYINFDDPHISIDFQQPIDGMESPWGMSQFALIYDSLEVPDPPRNLKALEQYIQANPGTFTISNDFSGMSLLKSFLAELSGSPNGLDGPFDPEKYEVLSKKLWDYINRNKKYFWKEGVTFPKEHSKMDQMFATGELSISFGFSEGAIEEKVNRGLYPKSTRAYAWENGTVLNSNYIGIVHNAPNKAGALQVINFLISPEAQLTKADPNGMDANPVLDMQKLPEEWRKKFEELPKRKYGAELSELSKNAIQEPAPEYMIKLYDDFRTFVIEK